MSGLLFPVRRVYALSLIFVGHGLDAFQRSHERIEIIPDWQTLFLCRCVGHEREPFDARLNGENRGRYVELPFEGDGVFDRVDRNDEFALVRSELDAPLD